MSPAVFICSGCGKEKAFNPRLPRGQQQFCGEKPCQRKRRTLWGKEKLEGDEKCRAKQAAANRDWRAKSPEYYREYRAARPHVVRQNRLKQRLRDRRRRPRRPGTDASAPVTRPPVTVPGLAEQIPDGYYLLLPMDVPRARALDVYVSRACKDGRVPGL